MVNRKHRNEGHDSYGWQPATKVGASLTSDNLHQTFFRGLGELIAVWAVSIIMVHCTLLKYERSLALHLPWTILGYCRK